MEGTLKQQIVPLFKWEIDIASFVGGEDDDILSPTFTSTADFDHDVKWELQLFPKGSEGNEGWLSLYLCLSDDDDNDIDDAVTARFYFTILNQDDEQVNMACFSETRFEADGENSKHGRDKFVKESFLQDPTNKLLKNNYLTVLCKVMLEQDMIEDEEEVLKKETSNRLQEFDTFEKLFSNKAFSDVTITAKGKNFKLHKCILSTRSSVFEAMFRNDMKERNQNTVEIKDIKYKILQELFRYMYTGTVNNIEKIVDELLIAADKYNVEGLKSLCEDIVCNELDENNAIFYLQLAVVNNSERIKLQAIKCISFCLEGFIKKEAFEEFGKQYPEVLLEIMKKSITYKPVFQTLP